jgi:hypothetical protein
MKVPDEIRKCVAFVGAKRADGSYQLFGSGFFLGYELQGNISKRVVFATARHVIDGVRSILVDEVYIRLNLKNGEAVWIETKLVDWYVHPVDASIDVAVLERGIEAEFDHLVLPSIYHGTEEVLNAGGASLGDEVFIVGLFRHHHGKKRNIPIVRVGNIACFVEEKIQTQKYGEIDAYLIEARSIGGLSGSPVFINLPQVYVENNTLAWSNVPRGCLVGLIHGHYDVGTSSIDTLDRDTAPAESDRVNTGIAIVVPFSRVNEVARLRLYGAS